MISVFTPSHDVRFLDRAYQSLKNQTCDDWEWVVLLNGKAVNTQMLFNDRRVRLIETDTGGFVGALKAEACNHACGDILLELDHDDRLMPTAIEEVKHAFNTTQAGFVYSNAIRCDERATKGERWDNWQYRQTEVDGALLDEPITPNPTPSSVSRIWYAPDHLRAFRRDTYERVGGYSREMRVLDDQDLMCRLYMETPFHHIDKGLYVYHIHGDNAWIKHNAEIQNNVLRIHDIYAESMALTWAKRQGLRCLDLGGRLNSKPGYETVDKKDADIVCDLNSHDWVRFKDSSVGVIRAMDVFEHLQDPINTMKECYRILAPGGYIFAQVPSTDGRGAFSDPTHRSYWNEASFQYYTDRRKAVFIDTPVRFQAIRLYTTPKNADEVCWTVAHLVSLKNNFTPPGPITI